MADWQNLDPEATREAEKYENPIPSRELVLARLSKRGAPATRSQLLDESGLVGEEPEKALHRRLCAMERDEQLTCMRRDACAPVDKLDLIHGHISEHHDGFGFLIPDDGGNDLFLNPTQVRLVFDGDRALARMSGHDRRGRREDQLVEVIEQAHEIMVGRYFEENGIDVVVTDSPKIQQEVPVPPGRAGKARHNQFVQVRVRQQPSIHRQAQGKIIKVLDDYMAPGMEIEVALRSYGIPHVRPTVVKRKAAKFRLEVAEKDKEKRVDPRQMSSITIDGEDAHDFDDAVYAETKRGGDWRLFIAVAGVSHYMKVDSTLDEEAARRGNSVYFPERVTPMLPEALSSGLCSLSPPVDRLAMVCEMTLSKAGKLTGYQFYEAVTHSRARLTHIKVSQLLEHPDSVEVGNLRQQLPGVVPHLQQLYALYKALLAGRHVRGTVDFETQKTCIVFGTDRKISEIRPTQCNDTHRLIEEYMLCANVTIVRFLQKHAIPVLYRVRDDPPQEKLSNPCQFLGELGLSLDRGKAMPTPSNCQESLEKTHDRADFRLTQTVMLRSLSQAVHSPDNNGHFDLNYDVYTRFTSPIRRYPDLLVHRAIHGVIRSKAETPHVQRAGAANMPKARIYPYNELRPNQLGEQCSMTERRVDRATRDVTNWLRCEYVRERVGETFPGVIIAVTGSGLFVELTDIFVEGLIHVAVLPGNYYHFDAVRRRLSDRRTGRNFRLGDTAEVVVARVDLDKRKIDLELAGNVLSAPIGRRKRNGNKSANTSKASKRHRGASVPEVNLEPALASPDVAVVPRRRAGKVQVLSLVTLELLAQAAEMLGNTGMHKNHEVEQTLLAETRVGSGRDKGGKKGKVVPAGKSAKGKTKGGKPTTAAKPGEPTKHRKGSSKPKANDAPAATGTRKRKAKS